MKQVRVGIIGPGSHARENLIPALRTLQNVKITAVLSRDAKKAYAIAQEFDIEHSYSDVVDMFNDAAFDVLVVSTTPEHHLEMLKMATERGIPVFVEKPPAPDLESYLDFLNYFNHFANHTIVQFGFNFRYADFFRNLEILTDNFKNTKFMKIRSYASKPDAPMWGYQDVLESSLYAIHIHAVEMLAYTLGEMVSVQKSVAWLDDSKYILTVIVTFKDGRIGVLELSNASNRFEFDVECVDSLHCIYKVNDFTKYSIQGRKPLSNDLPMFKHKESIHFEPSFLKGGFETTGYATQFKTFIDNGLTKSIDEKSLQSCKEAYKIIHSILK